MKAVRYDGPNEMSVVDLPEPQPAAGEVKLRVRACGICGSDVHGYTGESGRRTAGQVMGHEFAGDIAGLGDGVDGWSLGDRVAAFNIVHSDHVDVRAPGIQCCPTRKVVGVNMGTVGAFAEYVCLPARALARIGDGVSYQTALLNEPLAVSYHALRHVPADAKTLCIVGGGTIGQCLARVARALDRFDGIYLLEPLEDKRALAAANGATALPPDLELLRQHLPNGADGVVEAVGVEETVLLGLEATRPAGTLVLLGNLAKQVTLPLQAISSSEKHLVGSYGFDFLDFEQVIGWINEGRFDLAPMISGTCNLDETPGMFADLASGRRQAIKIVVEP